MSGTDGPGLVPGGETPTASGKEARLVLPAGLARRLARQAEDAYPREGCGLLLGRVRGPERIVDRIRPAANRWEGRSDRYLVDPGTLRRAVEAEAGGGPRVLGFFHSHPDAEPVPSETDRDLAWPWYLYLIVPVRGGRAGNGRAWELVGEDEGFEERTVGPPRGSDGPPPNPAGPGG